MERGPQVRGELKANARKLGESLYGIISLQSGPNSQRRLRELVENLLDQGAFGYKVRIITEDEHSNLLITSSRITVLGRAFTNTLLSRRLLTRHGSEAARTTA